MKQNEFYLGENVTIDDELARGEHDTIILAMTTSFCLCIAPKNLYTSWKLTTLEIGTIMTLRVVVYLDLSEYLDQEVCWYSKSMIVKKCLGLEELTKILENELRTQ